VPGVYHYTVGVFGANGKRRIVDNDAWNVTVGAAATAIPTSLPDTAPTLPADVPLAPSFAWSGPISAVFSGAGETVSGGEMISDSHPTVPASAVASYYETRLPRAGWTIDPSSAPAEGATSFTISATKPGDGGTRVCIVQFSDATVHIYFGTAGG
jgi:hypothetical protein